MSRNGFKIKEASFLRAEEQQQKVIEYAWITDWFQKFNEQIEKPIEIRETLMRRSEPQRCMQHSIVFSIYCTVCRKVLCASCMYSNMIHRKHRVIPIESASDEIKEDITTFECKIPKYMTQTQALISLNGEMLIKLDKEFNALQTQIHQFYQSLRQTFERREKEQIRHLKDMRETSRGEILQYNRELGRINMYITQKLRYYTEDNIKTNLLIAARNILQVLMHSSTFIDEGLLQVDRYKFPADEEKIKRAQEQIQYKVDRLLIGSDEKALNAYDNKFKNKNSKSVRKDSFAEIPVKKKENNQLSLEKRRRKLSSSIAVMGRSQMKL